MATDEKKEPSKQAWRRRNGYGDEFCGAQTKEPDAAAKKNFMANQKYFVGQEEAFEVALAAFNAEAEVGEPVTITYKELESATAVYDRYYEVAASSMGARHAMALALLDQDPPALTAEDHALPGNKQWRNELDKHITLVKQAYGKPWEALRRVCEEQMKKDGKEVGTGNYYVPLTVIRALDMKVDEGKAAAAKRRATAEANKKANAAEAKAS